MESIEEINELLAAAFGYYKELDIDLTVPVPFALPPLPAALRGYLEFSR